MLPDAIAVIFLRVLLILFSLDRFIYGFLKFILPRGSTIHLSGNFYVADVISMDEACEAEGGRIEGWMCVKPPE